MWRADYAKGKDGKGRDYRRGEWRHALSVGGSRNVVVEGLTLEESGGDGIYIYSPVPETTSRDIVVRDCVCDRNHRQGLSVISARNLLVENCVFKNTKGMPPEDGVDFEPNNARESFVNCVLRNCVSENNAGNGFEFALMKSRASTEPCSIVVENCRSTGDGYGMKISTQVKVSDGDYPRGSLAFRKCTFEKCRYQAVDVCQNPERAIDVSFSDCSFRQIGTKNPDAPLVCLESAFKDDPKPAMPTITGLVWPDRGNCPYFLYDTFNFAAIGEKTLPVLLADAAGAEIVDSRPNAVVPCSPLRFRHRVRLVAYADRARRVTIHGEQFRVGSPASRPTKLPVKVCDASGNVVSAIPLDAFGPSDISFDAPAAGFYSIEVQLGGHAYAVTETDAPLAADGSLWIRGGHSMALCMMSSEGSLYVPVKAGSRAEFRVRGSQPNEKVRLSIADASGNVVLDNDILCWTHCLTPVAAADGVWTVSLGKPSKGDFEDFSMAVAGVRPFLFLSPKKFWYSQSAKISASAVSPDGRNEIRLCFDPLSYEVLRDGRTVVGRSGIRLDVQGANLESSSPAVSTSRLSGRVNTPLYKKSAVALDGCETIADFGQWAIRLVARDDGVAYRFETKMPGRVRIVGERADVTVPDSDAACWVNYTTRVGCEETMCRTVRAQDVPTDRDEARMVYLPFAYSVNGTAVVVTESDVRDYPIWNMCGGNAAPGDGVCLAGRFAGWPVRECHSDGSTNRLVRGGRRVVVDEHAQWLVETDGTRTYPWRVFALADARFPAKLVESDIVYALAPTADEGVDFSWVKPGKVAWDWWNDWEGKGVTNCTTDTYFRYVDFASENGIEYVILDEGWSAKLDIWRNNPAVDVPAIIRHGREKGVGIILWMAWAQVVGDEERVASHFAKMGAAGFKIDFLDRGDAGVARFIEKFSAVSAKERMVVDYHGSYRPTGLHRRYPNVLNYEAVYGLEGMKVNRGDVRILDNDVKAAFLRMTAGPLDYTPGAMDNYEIGWYPPKAVTRSHPGSVGTRCRQMALMALYEAPLQMLCDSPANYLRNRESLAFMAATPVTWDETRGIAGSPDSFVVLARRKGSVWYLAGITNADARTCEFDTSFLGSGEWSMESFRDSLRKGDPPTSYLHDTTSIRAGDKLSLKMARGGGFVARFTAK
jgi:alpha-glucosidase